MSSDHYAEFYEFSDVTTLVAGSIGIVDSDGYNGFLHVDSVFAHVSAIDRASCAAAVNQCFHAKDSLASAGFDGYIDHKVS